MQMCDHRRALDCLGLGLCLVAFSALRLFARFFDGVCPGISNVSLPNQSKSMKVDVRTGYLFLRPTVAQHQRNVRVMFLLDSVRILR